MSKEKSPAFASNQRVPDALIQKMAADLAKRYGLGVDITPTETTTGSKMIRLQFSADEAYHITITRARR